VDAGLKLLYGLLASGVIVLRRLDGWQELDAVVQTRRGECGLLKRLDKAG